MSAAYTEAQALFCVKTDPKAWAKRIIYRHERNDKDLLMCQIKCAYEAMNQPQPK